MKHYYTYILASQKNGTLYTGVSSNLIGRVYQHKMGVVKGFTKRYGVHMLVHFEQYQDPQEAIAREKQIKNWKRVWKIELIESTNPEWRDLYEEII